MVATAQRTLIWRLIVGILSTDWATPLLQCLLGRRYSVRNRYMSDCAHVRNTGGSRGRSDSVLDQRRSCECFQAVFSSAAARLCIERDQAGRRPRTTKRSRAGVRCQRRGVDTAGQFTSVRQVALVPATAGFSATARAADPGCQCGATQAGLSNRLRLEIDFGSSIGSRHDTV